MLQPTRTTDFAASVDRTLHEATDHPSIRRFGHASAVPVGAPVALVKADRPPLDGVDRTLHHVDPSSGVPALTGFADKPPSLPLPVARVENFPADRPLPITGPVFDHAGTWTPAAASDVDPALAASQLAAVARSRARLDRARAYADRLGSHAAEIRAKLAAAAERQVAAAIGTAESDTADVGLLRGEAVEIDRQHRQALAILADVEAEHARHEADLAVLVGSDGAARETLKQAHSARAVAQTAADDAKAILDRAKAHADAVSGKLVGALDAERRHDEEVSARLRAALADGDDPPAASEAFDRTSLRLEDDLRTARATVDRLAGEHQVRLDVLAAAHRAVLGAVDGVLCVEAEAVAQELEAADVRALALRTRLHCYTKRTAGDYVRPEAAPPKMMPGGWLAADPAAMAVPSTIRLSATIGRVIASAPPPPHQGAFAANWTAETDAWSRYAAALATDAEADPDFARGPVVAPAPPLPVNAA